MISSPNFTRYAHISWPRAVNRHIKQAKTRIADIVAADEADFSSILALEMADEELAEALNVFDAMRLANATPQIKKASKKIGRLRTAFEASKAQDKALFALIERIWQNKDALNLDQAQQSVLEKYRSGFVRNGAGLAPPQQARISAIDTKLSTLRDTFMANARDAGKDFTLHIEDEAQLAGLPAGAIEAAHAEAKARKKDGWVFTLDVPSYFPFIRYAHDRNLRQTMWRAYNTRALGGKFDNRQNILDIVKLRQERAQLLGYNSHADFQLERRMAGSTDEVMRFLGRLRDVSLPKAKKEVAALKNFALETDGLDDFRAWDVNYYTEKLKQKTFNFDAESLRPYFAVDAVLKGCFKHCEKLFGISFKEAKKHTKYHEDVQVFEVQDTQTKEPLGLLYADFYPRDNKRHGAWQITFRDRRTMRDGSIGLPMANIVGNFTKPIEGQPTLLSFSEVETLFHETGHALQSLLTKIDYPSISGISVPWDSVELASQFIENFLTEKQTLDMFARHHETGAPMPDELLQGLKDTRNFGAGWQLLRQVGLGLVDMAWHNQDVSKVDDVSAFEREVLKDLAVVPYEGECLSPWLTHFFSGSYDAGYYSYQWAAVLDADAFGLFQEKGLYDAATAQAFRQTILERGGAEHPLELYKRFRGRGPDADASLRRSGLINSDHKLRL